MYFSAILYFFHIHLPLLIITTNLNLSDRFSALNM